jgi:hypothetical protein
MQRGLGFFFLVAGWMVSMTPPAAAQGRRTPVPDTGMVAVGFTVGASLPTDAALTNGIDLGAQVERYFTPRVSVRGRLSGFWADIGSRPFSGTIQPVAFEGNIVHNWERGVWHPYVTGGIGLYHYRFTEDLVDSSDNKFGVNFGGGAEYFFTRHDTLLGEALLRVVPGRTTSLRSDYEPGYWTLMMGYKKYF